MCNVTHMDIQHSLKIWILKYEISLEKREIGEGERKSVWRLEFVHAWGLEKSGSVDFSYQQSISFFLSMLDLESNPTNYKVYFTMEASLEMLILWIREKCNTWGVIKNYEHKPCHDTRKRLLEGYYAYLSHVIFSSDPTVDEKRNKGKYYSNPFHIVILFLQ